jgi:hypothetical protein
MGRLLLEDLFASKAHAKVLQYLIDNPGKGFSLRYLARVTGVCALNRRHSCKQP